MGKSAFGRGAGGAAAARDRTRPAAGRGEAASPAVDHAAVLNAVGEAVLVVGGDGRVRYANVAAEQLLQASTAQLVGQKLHALLAPDHPLPGLVRQVRELGYSLTEYGLSLESPRFAVSGATVHIAPVHESGKEDGDEIVVTVRQPSIAQKIDQQLSHRNAARSVAGMAAILAHEVKNPLAGIRGAAQLIEENLSAADRELTRLICEEADRICALVDRMDIFSDQRPARRGPVNIHEVLEHVRRVANTSFGRHVRIVEQYDPSLPPVLGNRDRLVQVFMNLVTNAVDAAPDVGGEIVLATAYRHGVRLAIRSTGERMALPLMVSVQDNGPGVPEDLQGHLFDPFVTTKPGGHGLGLALVANIVDEHGGVIEFDSEPRRTVFRVMLPVCPTEESA